MTATLFVLPSGRTVPASTHNGDLQFVVKCVAAPKQYPHNAGIYGIVEALDTSAMPAVGAQFTVRHSLRKSDLGTYERVAMPAELPMIRLWFERKPATAAPAQSTARRPQSAPAVVTAAPALYVSPARHTRSAAVMAAVSSN